MEISDNLNSNINLTTTTAYSTIKKGIGFTIETFTSSGTWTKPVGAKVVKVIAHGGGGSGSLGTYYGYTNTPCVGADVCQGYEIIDGQLVCTGGYVYDPCASGDTPYPGYGGGSGAPGARTEIILSADNLTSTVAVTVGSGGTGPVASSTPASGTDGGTSFFGSYVGASGGFKGTHGSSGTGGSLPANGTNTTNIFSNAYSAGQGGSGGNSTASSSGEYLPGNSGFPGSYIRLGANTLLGNNGTPTSINGTSGTNNRSGTGFGGDGGGGGSASRYNTSGNGSSGAGGNGSIPGGGGGGGGGRYRSTSVSGKGGDGARGEVIVITYF